MATMDRDEIHHKMSKKVAQLTKVIFHLNTRNDEADLHLASVTDAYEKEVEQIVQDANGKIHKLVQVVEKSRADGGKKQIEAVTSAFEEEKREAQRELSNLRTSMAAREQKNTTMWSGRLQRLCDELNTLKASCVEQASHFKASLQQAETRYAARLQELEADHRDRVSCLEARHEVELQKCSDERMEAEATLQRSFDDRLDEKSARLAQEVQRCCSLEEELRISKRRLDESLEGGQDQLRRIQEERDVLSRDLGELRAECERLKAAAAENAEALRERDDVIAELKRAASSAEQVRESLAADVDRLKKLLEASEAEIARARAERDALIAQAARDRDASDVTFASERRRLQDQVKKLEDEEARLRRELDASKASEVAKQDRVDRVEAEAAQLRMELDELRRTSDSAFDAVKAEAARLEDKLRETEAELERQRSANSKLEAQLVEQAALFEKRLEEAQGSGAKDLDGQRAAHAAELEALKKQHNERIAALKKDGEAAQEKVRADLERQLSDLRQEIATKEAEHRKNVEERDGRESKLKEEIAALERKLQEARDKAVADANRQKQLEDELAQLRLQLEKSKAEAEQMRKEHAQELVALRKSLQGDVAKSSEQHEKEMERLRNEMKAALAQKDSEARAISERLEAELRQAQNDGNAKARELQSRIDALQRDAEADRSGAAAELDRLRIEMARQLDEANTKAVTAVQELSIEHKNKLTEVFAGHSNDLKALQEKLTKSHQERVDEIRQKNSAELAELKAKHAAQVKEMTEAHTKKAEEMSTKHAAATHKLEEDSRVAAEKHAAEVRMLQEQLQQERGALAQAQKDIGRLEGNVQQNQAAIRELEAKLATAMREHAEALKKRDEDFAREKRTLREQQQADLQKLIEEQVQETTELKAEFDRAQDLQDMQIDMLQKRLQEMQDLYDSRPSREEDVNKIAMLEAALLEKEDHVKKLMEEMKFFKLELVNREQNYNKVFGAAPLVGTMNPVTSAKKNTSNGPPQMRIVQQPGAGMQMGLNMGLPPLGGLVGGPGHTGGHPPPGPARKNLNKRPSSDSIRRTTTGVD
eukprot:TRINITY_DN18020_c0_g1_i2.p1 TRINITY_DN18020_c0_g1~~TRINITY_DN18020_c0_g1_i2.p1  ORF type:complete len:1107 (-),score=322.83 TRINITY_DN18020_c0_g1_i2:160-3327(-)